MRDFCGRCEIRTRGGYTAKGHHPARFGDECVKPLRQPSISLIRYTAVFWYKKTIGQCSQKTFNYAVEYCPKTLANGLFYDT